MELRPKALAAYQAVLALMDEGADLNGMTVSEIAERAGIGKGTVYEYFTSKENLIAGAVLYEMNRLTEELGGLIRQETTFRGKVNRIFDCMKQYPEENHRSSSFIRLIKHSFDLGRPLCQELEQRREEVQDSRQLLLELYQSAQKEGLLRQRVPLTAALMTLISKFLMYMMYLEKREEMKDIGEQEMRNFLYQGILADLNLPVFGNA